MNNLKRYTLYIVNAVDIISCVLAYFLAYYIRFTFMDERYGGSPSQGYLYFLFVVLVSYFVVNFTILYKEDDFLSRNTIKELASVMKVSLLIIAIVVFYFNFAKMNAIYSRLFEAVYVISLFFIDLFLRLMVKRILNSDKYTIGTEKTLLVAPHNEVEKILSKAQEALEWRYIIGGIILTDKQSDIKNIKDIPVVGNSENMFSPELLNNYDSVIVVPGKIKKEKTLNWLREFKNAGKKVSVQIPEYDMFDSHSEIDNIGGLAVITYTGLSPMSIRQTLLKRLIDIVLSLLLLPIYLIVYILVKLFTSIESPGPVLVKRIRVGKNNRRFYQYRFRLFRSDATQKNENGEVPFTTIGKFLYRSHLDGLPMILNVFLGEMSFVGPKAPNLPLYLEMSAKERNLLACKPGIIGYWTSEKDYNKAIVNNEDYLENWSIFKDISIVAYCILRYFSFRSLRVHGKAHTDEEYKFADYVLDRAQPIIYDSSLYQEKNNIFYNFIKRTIDIILSLLALILLLPIFLIIIILVILVRRYINTRTIKTIS